MQEAILSNFCDTVSLYEEVTPIIEVKIVANGRAVSIVLFLYGFLNSEKILTFLLTSFNSMAGVKRNRLQIGYLTQTVSEVITICGVNRVLCIRDVIQSNFFSIWALGKFLI